MYKVLPDKRGFRRVLITPRQRQGVATHAYGLANSSLKRGEYSTSTREDRVSLITESIPNTHPKKIVKNTKQIGDIFVIHSLKNDRKYVQFLYLMEQKK
ncbi:MAG: hypothetical protein ACE364_07010 [Chlorobiota bacterium]